MYYQLYGSLFGSFQSSPLMILNRKSAMPVKPARCTHHGGEAIGKDIKYIANNTMIATYNVLLPGFIMQILNGCIHQPDGKFLFRCLSSTSPAFNSNCMNYAIYFP